MKSENIYKDFGISNELCELAVRAEASLKDRFELIDKNFEYNQLKIIRAMQECGISEACMLETTGYGYNDIGRDKLEEVYSKIFGTEDALVRSQIICGTHALTVAMSGNLRPGDEIFSPVGLPYDTIQKVIGISNTRGSFKEYGITFNYVDLLSDGSFDFEGIKAGLNERTRLIEIQRSRGYSDRRTFSVEEIAGLIRFIKGIKPDVLVLVDNCYGEYTGLIEPSQVGADITAGSLIKNPGGGIAPVGGYIAGTKECIANAAARLSGPGLEKELGPSLGNNRLLYQGTFLAPQVTASALKGAGFASFIFKELGFSVSPEPMEERHDIIQAVTLGSPEAVISFCRGIQAAAAVDSFVKPEPSPMPGYDSEIIMANGCFISGSSIELSADGPLREPYTVFFQGGLTYPHSKLGVLMAAESLVKDGIVKL